MCLGLITFFFAPRKREWCGKELDYEEYCRANQEQKGFRED